MTSTKAQIDAARPVPIEPEQDLVEALARSAWEGNEAPGAWDSAREDQAALVRYTVRAVLSALAGMGVKRIGRTEEETGVRVEHAIETAYACNGCGLFASSPNDPCAQCDVPRLDAILAAKDAEIASLRARAEAAEKRLQAVLEASPEDIAEAWLGYSFTRLGEQSEERAKRVVDLIRLRATEGAEAAP